MSYVVKILTPAEADTVAVALWYDAQLPGLGSDFLSEVNLAAERLALNPEIYSISFADVRRAPVHRFKFYGVYYLVRGMEVWVFAVFHGSRHPRWLMERRTEIN